MRAPVRIICENCLQSVDVSGELTHSSEARCPGCGESLLLTLPPSDGPTSEFNPAPDDPTDVRPSVQANFYSRVALGQIGRFKLETLLGDGGYGQVFLALDTKLNRHVALKVLKPKKLDERSISRFFQEAKLAAMLEHPNIVPVWDFGRDDDRSWISYKLIRGMNLAERLGMGCLPVAEAVNIAIKLASALHHAMSKKVVHRDIKPSNIMLDKNGEPFLTDFGLARRIEFDSLYTAEGSILGSVNYMSPEQARGMGNRADGRSDLFSLGIVLYEMLCGRVPIDYTSSSAAEPRKKLNKPYPSVRLHAPSVPKPIDKILRKALEIEPSKRYQEASQFMDALTQWRDFEAGRPRRRPKSIFDKGAIAAIVSSIGLAALYFGYRALPAPGVTTIKPYDPSQAAQAAIANEPKVEPTPVAKPVTPTTTEAAADALVGNSATHVVHYVGCSSATTMKTSNRREFASLEEAESQGYKLCGHCRR